MQNPDLESLLLVELNQMHWFENAWHITLGQLGRATYLPQLGKVLKSQRAYNQEHVLQSDEAEGLMVDTLGELEQMILDMTALLASNSNGR